MTINAVNRNFHYYCTRNCYNCRLLIVGCITAAGAVFPEIENTCCLGKLLILRSKAVGLYLFEIHLSITVVSAHHIIVDRSSRLSRNRKAMYLNLQILCTGNKDKLSLL